MTKEKALEILKENVKSENLRKHHYAVAASMRALAEYFGEADEEKSQESSADKWEVVGLLHDADYEETKNTPERHGLVVAEKLEKGGVSEDIIRAIKAHNFEHTKVRPKSKMEWSLVAGDDLTGLIVAVALVHPQKLAGVSVESVVKKFGSKSFAAGVDRERIKMCQGKLGIPLEEFVAIVLKAMQKISKELGL